jgi:hypothetical protein
MIYEAFRDADDKLFDTSNFYTFLTPCDTEELALAYLAYALNRAYGVMRNASSDCDLDHGGYYWVAIRVGWIVKACRTFGN